MIQSQRGSDGPRDLDHGTVPPDGRPLAEQPKWRRDFPIDWAEDEYVSRRELVKFIVLTSAAFTVGQFWIVIKSAFGQRPMPDFAPALAAYHLSLPGRERWEIVMMHVALGIIWRERMQFL